MCVCVYVLSLLLFLHYYHGFSCRLDSLQVGGLECFSSLHQCRRRHLNRNRTWLLCHVHLLKEDIKSFDVSDEDLNVCRGFQTELLVSTNMLKLFTSLISEWCLCARRGSSKASCWRWKAAPPPAELNGHCEVHKDETQDSLISMAPQTKTWGHRWRLRNTSSSPVGGTHLLKTPSITQALLIYMIAINHPDVQRGRVCHQVWLTGRRLIFERNNKFNYFNMWPRHSNGTWCWVSCGTYRSVSKHPAGRRRPLTVTQRHGTS